MTTDLPTNDEMGEVNAMWRELTHAERAFLINRRLYLTDVDCCKAIGISDTYPPKMRRNENFAKLEHMLMTYPRRVLMLRLEDLLLPAIQTYMDALQGGVPWPHRLKAADAILGAYSKLSDELDVKDKSFSIRWQKDGDTATGNRPPVQTALGPAVNTRLKGPVESSQVRTPVGEGPVRGDGDDKVLPQMDVRDERPISSSQDSNDDNGANLRGDGPALAGTPGVSEAA